MTMPAEQAPRTGRIEGGYDAIVVGAEPEGLICAAYLAKSGFKTIVLEGGARVGGRFFSREFAGGYIASDADYLMHHLDRQVIRELDLYKFGLEFSQRGLSSVIYVGGKPVVLDPDPWKSAEALSVISPSDGAAYNAYCKALGDLAQACGDSILHGFYGQTRSDLVARAARIAKGLSEDQNALALRLALASAADVLDEFFDHDAIKGFLAYEAVFGLDCGPRAPGTALGLLRRFLGEIAGAPGRISHVKGGMGALSEALRRAAETAGVEMRTEAAVSEIMVEWDEAAGVRLSSGGQIRGHVVISSYDVKTTYGGFFGPRQLDLETQAELTRRPSPIGVLRFNIALDAAPKFSGLEAGAFDGRFIVAPSVAAVENAFLGVTRGYEMNDLIMDFIAPTAHDPELAGDGQHVISGQIFPAPLIDKDGQLTEKIKSKYADAALRAVEKLAPDIRPRVVDMEIRTPADFAKDSGLAADFWAGGPPYAAQWLRLGVISNAGGVGGYYYCGPEAALGLQCAGAAARRAAQLAIKHARKRAVR